MRTGHVPLVLKDGRILSVCLEQKADRVAILVDGWYVAVLQNDGMIQLAQNIPLNAGLLINGKGQIIVSGTADVES